MCFSLAGCTNKQSEHSVEAIKKKGKIVIATESQYAPFCFKDKQGNFIGLEPVLMQAIADDLGVELEIMDIAFDAIVTTVQAGGADIGMAGLTPTQKRKEAVEMTDLYNLGGQAMLVKAEDAEKYSTKEALKGLTIAVQQGSLQQTLATEQFADCKQTVLPTVPGVAEELKAGNVAGALMDEISAEQYVKTTNGAIVIAKIPVDVPPEEAGSSAAVMKGNEDLLNYINGLIKKLGDEGKLDQWFDEAKTTARDLGMM